MSHMGLTTAFWNKFLSHMWLISLYNNENIVLWHKLILLNISRKKTVDVEHSQNALLMVQVVIKQASGKQKKKLSKKLSLGA